ncbi:cation channel sperm-associated auxiliary subunit delta-like [Watersipora subatra]|uniref:cation channel sperm-associated auxiliary subunit delta-like n=1 Tax=Watersipora subatra TaxID=2589382 RepID=UPI00355C8887
MPITDIINRAIKEATLPELWKTAMVTPPHKGGNKNNLSNYGPISSNDVQSAGVVEKELHMFCESLWQNMKIFVYCIAWSSITTLSNFLTLVSSLSCKGFSRDTQPLLQLLPAQFIWNQSYVEIVQDFKDVVFATDPCDRAKMAYAPISGAHQGKVLATSDAFQKTSVVLHIADSLIGGRPTLSHLVFLSGGLLTIINNEIFIFDFHSFLAKKTKGIQRADGVDMLSVHECCAVDYSCQVWGNVVLAYKLYSSTREFYYSQDGGLGFSKATISPTHSYKLLSSTVLAVDLTALFLAEDVQTSKLLLLTIPLNGFMHGQAKAPNSSVILLSEFDSYIPGDFIHMLQLRSDFYSLLLWDRHGILYKRRLDLEGVRIVVHNSGSNSTFLPKEHTRLADTNSLGEFLMITSHNRLLYGRESYIPEATYVTNLTFTLSNSTVMAFNDGGDVVILSPADTNKVDLYSARYLSTIHLPDEILKLSNIAPCPYQSLKADRLHHYYLIDIHGSVDLITIVYTDEMSNISIAVQTSAGQRLQLYNSISHTPTKQGLISHEMRTRAVPKRATYLSLLSRADRPLESGQGTALRVVTSSTSLSCPENSQNVAHITLGCEKGKRLVINREPGLCDKLAHSATYEIPAEFYDDDQGKYGGKQATKPKTVTYNFRRYGCANKTYYNNPFIFDLHLYQDATYLGPMKGDYVIYEVNGVNKFNYSLTLNTSGCAVRPQTWREMLLSAPDNASMDEVWTRKGTSYTLHNLKIRTKF